MSENSEAPSTKNDFTIQQSLTANEARSTVLPRLAVPVSIVISRLISFGIQFGIFVAFMIYFGISGAVIHPNAWLLLTPCFCLSWRPSALAAAS